MRTLQPLLRWLSLPTLLALSMPAQAHKLSDSYLQLNAGDAGMTVRWDIALRDLDAALDLDANADGRLTWGEIKASWPAIENYALPRLRIAGCPLQPVSTALERRSDGAYAVIFLRSACALPASPAIEYSLFREVDPTHRGIAKIERANQPLLLQLLDPTTRTSFAGQADPSTPAAGRAASPVARAAANDRWAFLREGIRHILTGYDHVLFLLCLLLPSVMRRTPAGWQPVERLRDALWPILGIVSAFTLAHSITLALAALKLIALPSALIEPAIAVTIVLAALDNLLPVFPVRRVIVTFCFGLIHGFGFAGVLAELNLPRAQFAWALLQFNVGLELGQLAIVVAAITALFLMRRMALYRYWVIGAGSVTAMFIALLWFIERTAHVSVLPG